MASQTRRVFGEAVPSESAENAALSAIRAQEPAGASRRDVLIRATSTASPTPRRVAARLVCY